MSFRETCTSKINFYFKDKVIQLYVYQCQAFRPILFETWKLFFVFEIYCSFVCMYKLFNVLMRRKEFSQQDKPKMKHPLMKVSWNKVLLYTPQYTRRSPLNWPLKNITFCWPGVLKDILPIQFKIYPVTFGNKILKMLKSIDQTA